jgi:hypothetical protein
MLTLSQQPVSHYRKKYVYSNVHFVKSGSPLKLKMKNSCDAFFGLDLPIHVNKGQYPLVTQEYNQILQTNARDGLFSFRLKVKTTI